MKSVDVLIITALQEEFNVARAAGLAAAPDAPGVREWLARDVDGDGLTPYLLGDYLTVDGRRISVALARPTNMGGRGTNPIATTLVNVLKPNCLAMCGVCAGNPDETAPGDVVIAELAYEYDEGKITGSTFQGDHRQYPQDIRWVRAAQEFRPEGLPSYGAATEDETGIWFLERLRAKQDPRTHRARERYFPRGTWRSRLERLESSGLIERSLEGWALTDAGMRLISRELYDEVDGPQRLPFAVLTGPFASGSSVIKHSDVWRRLKHMGVRKIMALEMEAATIATVANDRGVPHWLVAKGVMDHADLGKDDRYKEFAARASAEVLYSLLVRLVSSSRMNGHAGRGGSSRPPTPTPQAALHGVPGRVKLDVIHRLEYDWQDLADILGVPAFVRVRFHRGEEPRELWEWLDNRRRLPELPDALDEVGRSDLAELVRYWLVRVSDH